MKIGFEYMLSNPVPTGVQRTIRQTLEALARRLPPGTLTVFTNEAGLRDLPEGVDVHGVVCSRMAGWYRGGRILWQQHGACHSLTEHPVDLYHAPGYILRPNRFLAGVVTVYDTIALDAPGLTTYPNRVYYRWAVPRGIRAAARVVVPTHHVRRRLIACTGVASEKVEVIPLGISKRFLCEHDGNLAFARNIGLGPGEKYILSVGRKERKKNLRVLLEALACVRAKECPALKLVMVGDDGNDTSRLRAEARRLGVEHAIIETGYVSDQVLAELYRGAAALVYPSFNEGFGLPPLEAMACGTVAIVSAIPALEETAEHAALYASPTDVGAWVHRIDQALFCPEIRRHCVEAGHKRVQEFTWERHAERLCALYSELGPDAALAETVA